MTMSPGRNRKPSHLALSSSGDRYRTGSPATQGLYPGRPQDADSAATPARIGQTDGMDWKLEVVVVPVSDMDRAKTFYNEKAGFGVDVDHQAGEDFRVIQLTPPGSACSVTLMRNEEAAGSVQGLHLIVSDIEAAHAELTGRGATITDFFHFGAGGQEAGLDPQRADYGSFFSFADPDGNGWLVQEVKRAG